MSDVDVSAHAGAPGSETFPKIELHVHLEGTSGLARTGSGTASGLPTTLA